MITIQIETQSILYFSASDGDGYDYYSARITIGKKSHWVNLYPEHELLEGVEYLKVQAENKDLFLRSDELKEIL